LPQNHWRIVNVFTFAASIRTEHNHMKNRGNIYIIAILLLSITVLTGAIRRNPVDDAIEIAAPVKIIPKEYSDLFTAYNEFIEAEIDTTRNVGAAISVVVGDSIVFTKPYGVRKAGSNDSVDVNTVFRLASVSKGFAGVLAAKLENENRIDLDDKIKYYLPDFDLKDSLNEVDLTLRHTLNHTTGLVPHTYDNLVEANQSMSEILKRLNEVDIAAAPGEVYGYQNALYSLIDTVLLVKTDTSYTRFLEYEFFRPLGMVNASTDFNSMAEGSNVALPHVNTKSGPVTIKPNKRYYKMSPAAGVNASISDMSIWLQALLGYYPEVLDTNIQKTIVTPTIQTPLKRRYTWRWNGLEEKYYSLGWRIFRYRGYDIVYHGGFVKGYRAEISFCPELNAGVVFLQNSPNRLSSESVPVFWEMYFDKVLSDSTSI
jgi:beta-lactamase class C